ncbi:MAG: VWA domain-containing protein [Myxococcota bacterium]
MLRQLTPPILLLALGLSCTEADLQIIQRDPPTRDDRVALGGEICTRPPASRVAPLRVLFVVDASDSMEVTDPPDPVTLETGRQRAVRETWEQLIDADPEGVRAGVIRFSSEAQGTTPVDEDGDGLADTFFTADRTLLAAATDRLAITNRSTNYANALAEAYLNLRTEYLRAEAGSLPLSRYVVIFLSDGLPDGDRGDAVQEAIAGVQELVDLARVFRVGRFEFNTAYLSAGRGPELDREAQELLQSMAELGGGTFRSFPSGESINFLFAELTSIRRAFSIDGVSVINLNTVIDIEQVEALPLPPIEMVGLDGGMLDGGDVDDAALDMAEPDMSMPDTGVEDMFTDMEPVDLGYMPEVGPENFADRDGDGRPGCGEPMSDTDADGLADLLEGELATDPRIPDTDDDGLRDGIEWRNPNLDPLDPEDARCIIPQECRDEDGDGFCDCLADSDLDGICDCAEFPELTCRDDTGHDCVDEPPVLEDGELGEPDGFCDCLDADADGRCDYEDRDGDLLNDCEEQFSGTRTIGFDSEPDGLADLYEVLRRGDAVDLDKLFDSDWDDANNEEELLAGTDLMCDESSVRSRVAHVQEFETISTEDGQTCYAFEVRNIALAPTLPNPAEAWPGNGWNRLLIYANENSFDDPDAFGTFRLACVMVRYEPEGNFKNPPSGRVRLSDDDFIDAEVFDADVHCIWP